MHDRSHLIELLTPLKAARSRARRRTLRDGHALRLSGLFGVIIVALVWTDQHPGITLVMTAIGAWAIHDRAQMLRPPTMTLNTDWLAQAIEMDLTPEGRCELSELLLRDHTTISDGLRWGRRELRRVPSRLTAAGLEPAQGRPHDLR